MKRKSPEKGRGWIEALKLELMLDPHSEHRYNSDRILEAIETVHRSAYPSTCRWSDEGGYHSACGQDFTFNEDGPTENGFKFCPFCGRRIP